MNGIIVVDKPAGFTSFDVVAKMRGICATRRIGHGGTLDPMATGVLPVFVGHAAKAVDLQPKQDKTYEGTILLGVSTDTGDVTGTLLQKAEVTLGAAEVQQVLPKFVGEQEQLPPMYSAVKVDGKPLYKYAREGKQVPRKWRHITIHSIVFLADEGENRYRIRVHCSKGTYIRSLVEDIGKALGLPATLAALRRTKAGVFAIEDAFSLEQLQAAKDAGGLQDCLLPVEQVFADVPLLVLGQEEEKRLCNGAPVPGKTKPPGRYRVAGASGFLGLAQLGQDGILRVEKMFVER